MIANIGVFLIALPFILISAFIAKNEGAKTLLIIILAVCVLVLPMIIGVYLLQSQGYI